MYLPHILQREYNRNNNFKKQCFFGGDPIACPNVANGFLFAQAK